MQPMLSAVVINEPEALNAPTAHPNRYIPVVPNGQVCPVTGLKHAKLYSLLKNGEAAKHVRVLSLKEPGAARGKLLFHVGDMLRWFDSLAASQAQQPEDTAS